MSITSLFFLRHPVKKYKRLTFPRPLKEESHNENLQASHTDHQPALDHAEIEYPRLRALDRAEIPILTCTEVLLVAIDG